MIIGVDAREFDGRTRTGIGRYIENLLGPLSRGQSPRLVFFARRGVVLPACLLGPAAKTVALPDLPDIVLDEVAIPLLARREGVGILFSPYYKTPLFGSFKRIVTVHDIMFLRLPGLSDFKRACIARRLLAAGNRADIVLVDSDFTVNDLADFAPGLRPKIRRLAPDLSASWLHPVPAETREEVRTKYAAGNPFLLYVGNFKPHKKVDLLVEAFARMARESWMDQTRLVLAGGDARNVDRIAGLIQSSGLQERIAIARDISDGDLRGLYAAADWFVMPSEYEGFGYPVLEAMALGCPVVCRAAASLPEITGAALVEIDKPGADGIAMALRRALTMPNDAKATLVALGKKRAERFAPGSAAASFAKIIDSLVPG